MKKGYLKYSDERNKCYSIKTEIDFYNKEVRKQPIYEEGNAHIDNILAVQDYLKEYYPKVDVCKAWKEGNAIVFEFVEGESLFDKYNKCLKEQDIKTFEKLLLEHKEIICGGSENICRFSGNDRFTNWFGEQTPYIGREGLKIANFDAIASNIIIRGNVPVFIDYEWVMSFEMPKELVIYHCVHDAYLHNKEFEDFYSIKKVLDLLEVKIDIKILEESYKCFFDKVISESEGSSYAKDKYTCLKNVQTMDFILEEWEKCAENWKLAIDANEQKDKELTNLRKGLEDCAENWKSAIASNEQKDVEIVNIRKEWKSCAQNWKDAVEANAALENKFAILQKQYDELLHAHNEVINSKVWRANVKLHKLLGK